MELKRYFAKLKSKAFASKEVRGVSKIPLDKLCGLLFSLFKQSLFKLCREFGSMFKK